MAARVALTGRVFGRLTVLGRGQNIGITKAWLCRCECGRETTVITNSLNAGLTRSCGCLQDELRRRGPMYRHGDTIGGRSKEHVIWTAMIRRCGDPSVANFPGYGGRGIGVCERWQIYENFLADMGRCPKGRSLDRRDNEAGYSPDNCRWATRKEQARNTRATLFVAFRGKRRPLREVAEITGVNYFTLYNRLSRGFDLDEAIARKCPPGRPAATIDLSRAILMRKTGATYREIAEAFHVSQATILNRLRELL